ncbi:hypothetical protein [Ohtaekwangia sp.]|uniref:hypothetical protein n=1 Tax=Ohtaekwangia sp. TaxID=2066019 RepID=UPI002F94F35C
MKNTVKLALAALVFSFVVACQPKKTEESSSTTADSAAVEAAPVDSAATTPVDSTATAPADSTAHH